MNNLVYVNPDRFEMAQDLPTREQIELIYMKMADQV